MITKIGRVGGPRSPSIHLGAACPQMISSCLTAPDKSGDVAAQTLQILDVIDGHLSDQGSGREKLMMVQVWLADIREFAAFRRIWNDWILPDHPPALSVVEAAASRRDSLVEIRAYAAP
ncbi:Rid family hydrolase [Sedimentitalea sp. JM2-8]|uniref:Rid family hydrolase n=1 Tax=Sedimentitalea xiamensis TaxID=3050037 RepID=A0ABT7FL54_9RHOB|nr:Rid family hydrolase [Sedimentitalea xiamensis]MDK3075837.1 Rid family hydrolase [Sedimentitalea xiamensis]